MRIGVLEGMLQSLQAQGTMSMESFVRVRPMIIGLNKDLKALRLTEQRLMALAKAR